MTAKSIQQDFTVRHQYPVHFTHGKIAPAGPLLLASIQQTVYSRSQPISLLHLSVDYT
ncbi:hypothetical protein [Deinococcus hohokamensis]|uniref:Uncharacterized protein n=1 Tax=Deinococcus hohokamensis TaxID=309883 RepID=A0ABV9I6C8_9DEIO